MFRTVLFLAIALLVPKLASACECVQMDGPLIRPGSKGIIATGRVLDVRAPDDNLVFAAEIQITEGILNAATGAHVTVYTHLTEAACGYPRLRQGESILLFTDYVETKDFLWRGLPTPTHIVQLCGRTKALDSLEGQQELAAIHEEMKRTR